MGQRHGESIGHAAEGFGPVIWFPVGRCCCPILGTEWGALRFHSNLKLQTEKIVDIIRIILSVILPPLGVFLQVGLGKHFWINILLTILGYIPGIVHAIWIIAKTDGRARA